MSETARETAQRVVNKLLDGDTQDSSKPQLEARQLREARIPLTTRDRLNEVSGSQGGGSVPKAWHQGKVPSKTSASGAKSVGGTAVPKAWHQGKIPHKTSSQGATSGGGGSVAKAWKPGYETDKNGDKVAKEPGAVSYREALMRRVVENIKKKKAIKGMGKTSAPTVAKAPGKVKFGK